MSKKVCVKEICNMKRNAFCCEECNIDRCTIRCPKTSEDCGYCYIVRERKDS